MDWAALISCVRAAIDCRTRSRFEVSAERYCPSPAREWDIVRFAMAKIIPRTREIYAMSRIMFPFCLFVAVRCALVGFENALLRWEKTEMDESH